MPRRIESGRLGGRKLLELPRGVAVRPTAARVRGALFDRLGSRLAGNRVLDLFAGSGALAFEALSRGASEATLFERDRRVVRFLQRQVEALDLTTSADVVPGDAMALLGRGLATASYDLVLVDPPYSDADAHAHVLGALVEHGWLAPGAVVVCEREQIRGAAPELPIPSGLELEASKRYGQTVLDFHRARR